MRRHLAHNLRYVEKKPRSTNLLGRTFRSLYHKETIEVIFLCAIVASNAWLITHHAYFQMNDISITGLDTYASAEVQTSLTDYLHKTHFGIPHASFIGFTPTEVIDQLHGIVALDTITVVKKFPHTIQINAAETPMRIRINAINGTALVSADGLLVRWYPTGSTEQPVVIEGPSMQINSAITPQGILQPILEPQVHAAVVAIRANGASLNGFKLQSILYDPIDDDRFVLQYEQGTQVIVSGSANISVQLQKAIAAIQKTGVGKKIDVRFADKVFVSPTVTATTTVAGVK